MGQLRGPARVFVWMAAVAGGALLVFQWHFGTWPLDVTAKLVVVFLALAGLVADVWGIHLHTNKVIVSLSTTTNFAAMILFGPAVSGLVGIISSAVSDLWARRAWYKILFNCANIIIPINAAAVVYLLLNDGSAFPLSSLRNGMAIFGAALAYLTVNSALVCIVVGLADGYRPWEIWRATIKHVYFPAVTLFPLGTLIVIVYHQTVWGLVLLLFPIVLTQYSFQAYRRLQTQSQRTIETLARAVDHRDPYTYRHSERVALFAEHIARRLGLDISDTETVKAAALVHDLGKIGIEGEILRKPGALDAEERRKMQEHPRIGAEIIGQLTIYESVRDLVAYHQERFDGKGYPYGLTGKDLPLGARIIAVADAFEAMTSDRPYRKALSTEVARHELLRGRGTQFDPVVVDAFLAVMAEVIAEDRKLAPEAAAREHISFPGEPSRKQAAVAREHAPHEQVVG